MPRSTCMKCGQVFSGTTTFDRHRIGVFERYEEQHGKMVLVQARTRRCMTREEMLANGMVWNEQTALWSGEPMTEAERQRARGGT